MRKETPLAVQVPAPDHDGPGWVKVGVIAAVGFVIGVAWPRVMGVKLGPNAPGESASAAAAAGSASAKATPDAPPASVSAKATAVASAAPGTSTAPAAATGAPQVSVHAGSVVSCKTSDGDQKKGTKECGSITGLDSVVVPHLRKLATCSAAEGQTGKLSFVATADFPSGRLSWDVGKSSTVGNVEGITNCLKTHFSGVTATGVAHEHARYTVSYMTTLAPSADAANAGLAKVEKDPVEKGGEPAAEKNAKDEKTDKPDVPAGGEASVGWEVALVRDVPKTGQVVARLPRGTKVKVGSVKDGWYTIKYGDGFASEGFVYRGALNR